MRVPGGRECSPDRPRVIGSQELSHAGEPSSCRRVLFAPCTLYPRCGGSVLGTRASNARSFTYRPMGVGPGSGSVRGDDTAVKECHATHKAALQATLLCHSTTHSTRILISNVRSRICSSLKQELKAGQMQNLHAEIRKHRRVTGAG